MLVLSGGGGVRGGGRTGGEDDDVGFHLRAVFEDEVVGREVRDLAVLEVDLSREESAGSGVGSEVARITLS